MPKFKAKSIYVLLAVAMVFVAGCSAQARHVSCEGRLRPINAPAPTSVPAAAPAKARAP